MGISHSYEFGIVQTWWRWKDYYEIFPTISGSTPNSSRTRSYGLLKLTKNPNLT
ncbi:hypothetical protein MTR67_035507 [Solanum verrucosum]|uniref:Uncharacterized protein n=1 Tax=Solanum verrucosum TaxID=315347 RepID=A0AAF0ZKC8_SOLVR|nr:hypothetical protein MTR67_035507 [Solanum verrucosum]